MSPQGAGTRFRARGRLAGLIRGEPLAGTAPNRASRAHRDQANFEEALYYRARLILGDSLPRPDR